MAITLSTDLAKFIREECGENVYLCYQCERCSSGCPTAPAMRYRPAQIMRMAQFGLEDMLATDASIWRCLGCDNCTVHCPHNLSVRRLVEVMRQHVMQERYLVGGLDALNGDEALRKGVQALGMLGERISTYYNVSGEDNSARLAWTDNLAEKPEGLVRDTEAQLVYFVGCVSAMFPMSYGIPQSFATVLERAGVRFTTLGGDEWCCGFPLLMAGQLKQAEALARHNVEQVRALGVPRMVATCPSCYHMWHHTYPEILGEPLGFEVVHAVEVLRDLVTEGRLELKEPRRTGVVTYHDPCDLGRKSGIFDAPREVLRQVPGYTFVEMQQTREHALCCGGGGDLETFDPDLVQEVAAQRIAQAAEVKATVLVSACPQCVRTLSKAARAQRVRIRVLDLTQFIEMALA
ncbi:MAG: (Fe-S)-binding protein [Chloroflexi bacterium]|nr:MAG: (Fe-S)-binding protein [Chloroflexota bacterium]RLC91455.1 MAG: (Fe-S)-binding protein [Chloroflexota bacterium]HEY67490.1 (Fe-S)-binding protein [Thermoflexia bacterium]